MKNRTLIIIKPDGVKRGLIGEVIKRFERVEFKVIAMKLVHMSKEQAKEFYIVHKEQSYYEGLADFMATGPSVALVLQGSNVIARTREIIGPYGDAAPAGTIRHDYATSVRHNVVHGSDSYDSAQFEIGFFFNTLEFCDS